MPKRENTVAFIKNVLTMQCAFGIIIKLTFGTVLWPVGQAAKTPASHAGNAGSIPARVTKRMDLGREAGFRYICEAVKSREALTGAYDDEVPPVPIPNTEVKLIRAEDTWRETAWKNRSVPT